MSQQPLLTLENLSIRFGDKIAVHNLNLVIHPGERFALVGESGSGKTITALSILRLVEQARISGRIGFEGRNLTTLPDDELREIRGRDVAVIFQEPMSALNPLFTIGNQIIETLVLHEKLSPKTAREKAIQLLARTGLREPERRIDSYPHQLSGGQLQRAVIAMALACRPKLLIADEPTTALDTTIRARIVKLLLDLQEEELSRADGSGMAILLITHDLKLVRQFAQRIAVLERGHLVELAPTEKLFTQPRHPYTRKLLNSVPTRAVTPVPAANRTVLASTHLRVEYPKPLPGWRGLFKRSRFIAVAGADIELREGETIGVVGESGSGKSTLAQAILRLIPRASGQLEFPQLGTAQSGSRERRFRAHIQVVFQDPYGSLSPRRTIAQIISEGLELHHPDLPAATREQRIQRVLHDVGLPPSALQRYPHEFSGGQRQRIAIARALILEPRILVLDEPTSALDVSIQNQVLELLVQLQKKYGLSYLLISHDLAVIHALAHRVYVMKDGEIVESGETTAVIARPQHPYTQRLIQASL